MSQDHPHRDEDAPAKAPADTPVAAPPPAQSETHLDDAAEASPYDEIVAQMLTQPLNVPKLAEAVEQQQPPDAADTLEDLWEDQAAEVLVAMEERAAAEALAEMETPLAVRVVEDLVDEANSAYAGMLIGIMAPDDAADLLQAIDQSHREGLLKGMPLPHAAKLRRLISYNPESAGGLMTTDYIALRDAMTIAQATDVIRRKTIPDQLQHLLVTDAQGHLMGIIGLRELLINKPQQRIAELMNRSIRTIRPQMDREQVAREFDRYDYAMMPVVDDADRLIGVVTVDDVIDIIKAEQTEDVQRTVGAGAGEAVYSGMSEKFKGRFPWLGASLVMTGLSAAVVLGFEELIARRPILAFLMPVIAALVGNAGHQALAVTLRGIVLDQVRRDRVAPLILREGATGLLNGCVLGALMFLGVTLLGRAVPAATWQIGMVAGISGALAMGVGTLAGSGIPLLMRRLGADPAQSSAIFLIMITDAVSFSFLLLLTLALAS